MKTIIYNIHTTNLGEVLIGTYNGKLCKVAIGSYGPGLVDRFLSNKYHIEYDWDNTLIDSDLTKKVINVINTGDNEIIDYELFGTLFQRKVWNEISIVPKGQTITYGEIAKRIGSPKSARAVGTACNHNPLAVIIPCHRVILSNGYVGQYAWDSHRKLQFLKREGINVKPTKDKYAGLNFGERIVKEITDIEDKKIFKYLNAAIKSTNKI